MSKAGEKPEITVRRAAMNLLARREQSFLELTQKLTQKFPDLDQDTDILPALERLREENLQSDARFVEAFVRYRATRGVGPLRIGMELKQKGASEHLVRAAINSGEHDWLALCRETMLRKYDEDKPASLQEKQKRYRFLQQRGFDSDHIRQVLDQNLSKRNG